MNESCTSSTPTNPSSQIKVSYRLQVEVVEYLNNKLESASHIGIIADNNNNVDIADPHVKERASTNLPHRASTKLLGLHNMSPKSIHHISPAIKSQLTLAKSIVSNTKP